MCFYFLSKHVAVRAKAWQGRARQNRRHNEAQSSDSRQPTSIYESRFYMLFGMSETGGDAGVSNV